MSLGSIVVRLSMQTADFETDAGRAAKIAERRAKEIDASFRRAGVAIGAALGAAALVGVAGLKKYIQNTIEAEKVQAQLASRIADTAGAAGRTLDMLNEQAEKLQAKTIFDDEAIGGAQAMLLTFKQIQGVQFDKTIEASLDLATVMGTDATDAAKLLGKALADPEKGMSALSRAGVVFTEAEREAIKAMAEAGSVAKAQDAILAKLDGTMGSAAESARNTLGGALRGLSNDFDNLLEGDSGSDGVRGTVDAVNELSRTLNDPGIKSGIDNMASGLMKIAGEAVEAVAWLGNLAGAVADYYGDASKQSKNVLQNRRNDLETEMFQLQRSSGWGLSSANDPFGKLFGLGSGKDGKLAKIKAEIAEIDRSLERFAGTQTNRTFSPAYERASLNFDPNPSSPAAPASRASGTRSVRSRAMPDFLGEDTEALRRMVEQTTEASEAFDRMAATLSGPLAAAEYEHQQNLKQIAALGLDAEASSDQVTRLKDLETKRYRDETKAIEERLNPAQGLIESMEAELALLQMTGDEREREIATRMAGANATKEQIARIGELTGMIDMQLRAERDQIESMDAFRGGMSDFFTDLRHGVDAWDALTNAAANFFDEIASALQRRLLEQLFGQMGSAQTGSAGGGIWGLLGGIFGGMFGGASSSVGGGQFGWAGAGYASGGWTGPGGMNEIAGPVHRDEVVWSRGDVARSGGVGAVEAMRRGGGKQDNKRQRIAIFDDMRNVKEFMRSAAGEEVVFFHLGQNPGRIRELLS